MKSMRGWNGWWKISREPHFTSPGSDSNNSAGVEDVTMAGVAHHHQGGIWFFAVFDGDEPEADEVCGTWADVAGMAVPVTEVP
jgi:hypothetical protein